MQRFVVVLMALLICREAAAQSFTNGDIYLYPPNEDYTNNVGVVQIYLNGLKKYVCNDGFNQEAANAACRQVGFETEDAKFGPAGGEDFPGYTPESGTQPGITDVRCSGYQRHILRCSNETAPDSCTAVVVECENTTITENPYDGQVRLVGGDDGVKSAGRLEIYLNNIWRAVCSEGFTDSEADSVCRQLGYTNATSFPSVPRGNLMAWLLNSTCENSQECFTSCFEYPDNSSKLCSEIVSIACTFDAANSDLSSGGTFCVYFNVPVAGIVLGVVSGSLALLLVIVIIVVAVCMLVPSCFLSKKRKRRGYIEVWTV